MKVYGLWFIYIYIHIHIDILDTLWIVHCASLLFACCLVLVAYISPPLTAQISESL